MTITDCESCPDIALRRGAAVCDRSRVSTSAQYTRMGRRSTPLASPWTFPNVSARPAHATSTPRSTTQSGAQQTLIRRRNFKNYFFSQPWTGDSTNLSLALMSHQKLCMAICAAIIALIGMAPVLECALNPNVSHALNWCVFAIQIDGFAFSFRPKAL